VFTCKETHSGIQETIEITLRHLQDTIILETRTLSSILDEYGAPEFIHYMSIDTEGSEMEILRGFDFNRWTVGYMTIEHNFDEPKRKAIREYLRQRGYLLERENNVDDDFIHESIKRKGE
jgi:hypothetical protein